MNHDYAKRKLALLLRDVDNYNDGEFFREMSRIVDGATNSDGWEELAAQNERLRSALMECAAKFDQYAKRHKENGRVWKTATNSLMAMTAKAAADLPAKPCLEEVKLVAMKKGYWQGFETAASSQSHHIDHHWNQWLEFLNENKGSDK